MQLINDKVKVLSRAHIMPDTFKLSLIAPEIAAKSLPGQFLMVKAAGCTLRRPVSIHNVVDNRIIELLVRITGRGSADIAAKQEGDELEILGPLGNGFNLKGGCKQILLIAGGIGIAPLFFLSSLAVQQDIKTILMMGARSIQYLLPPDSFPSKVNLIYSTEDGSLGHKGIITDIVMPYLGQCDRAYACGPLPMYQSLLKAMELDNIKTAVEVSLEVRMGCGFGVCYGCSIMTNNGMKQVCRDGPVFGLDQVDLGWVKI